MNEEKNKVLEISETIAKDFDKAGISAIITPDEFDNLSQLRTYLTKN